jgi:hypothetical protein
VVQPAQGSWMFYQWSITGGKFRSNYWPYEESTESYANAPTFYIADGATEVVLSVRVQDDQGCWSPVATRSVLPRTIPAPVIEAPEESCPGRSAYASVEAPPQGSWMFYEWLITGGKFRSNYWPYEETTTSYNVAPTFYVADGATEVVLSVRVQDDQGCWSPVATRSVLPRTIPAPVINAVEESCPGTPQYASVVAPPQGSWMFYEWSITGGKFRNNYPPYEETTTSYDVSPAFSITEGSAEAVLSVRVQDDQGCWTPVATRGVVARVIAPPVLDAPERACPSVPAFASVAPPPPPQGGNWAEYEWTITGGMFAGGSTTANTQFVSYMIDEGAAEAVLSVRVREDQGCWSPVTTRTVLVRTIPAPLIDAPTEACPMVPAFASVGPPPPSQGGSWTEYEWTITGGMFAGGVSTVNTQYVNYMIDAGATQAVLSLRARDDQGCWSPVATRTVLVRTIPAPLIDAPSEACPMVPAFASVGPPPPSQGGSWTEYEWTITGGMFAGGVSTVNTQYVNYMIDAGATEAVLSLRARDNQGCWSPVATRAVLVRTIPAPLIDAPSEACPMVPAFASVGPPPPPQGGSWTEYEWTITGGMFAGGVSTVNTQYVNYTIDAGATQAVLSLRTRDIQGCWSPVATRTVLVRTIPAPVIDAPNEACPMVPAFASAAPPQQGSWTEYDWTITGGMFAGGVSTVNTQYVNYTIDAGATEAVLSLRARDDQGCWSPTATRTVLVRTIAAPAILAPAAVCAGGSGAVSIDGTSWSAYEWTIAGGTFDAATATASSDPNVTIYPSGTGPMTLSVRARDGQGCWSPISTATVNVNPRPAAGIRAISVYGDGDATVASQANGVVEVCGSGNISLVAEAAFALDPTYTYLWSNGGTRGSLTVSSSGTYSVTVTTANGCSTTSTVVVHYSNYPAKPAIGTPSGTQLCPVGGSVTLTAPAADGWTWSNGATTQSIVVTQPGSYTVRVRSGACESLPSDAVVIANGQSTISAGGSLALCQNQSVTLTANAGTSWLWSNGATTRAITVSEPGTYSVTTTNGSCVYEESAPVTVTRHAVSISANGPTTFCDGGSVTLTAQGDADTYYWSHGPSGASVIVTEPGTYFVTGYYTGGCSIVSNTIVVTVPETTLSIQADRSTVCLGAAIQLTSSVSGSSGYTYQWYQGSTYDPIQGATSPSLTITPSASGFVYLKVTDATGCITTSNSAIYTVTPTPDATITPSGATTWCGESAVTLTAPAGYSYLWSNGATSQSIYVDGSGSYSVTVSNGGCSVQSATVVVTENTLPDATVTPSGPLTWCGEGSVTLTAPAGLTYAWSNGAGTRSIVVDASGSFYVDVNNGTCTARSATVVVTENAIPDATITPSGPTTWCGTSSVTLSAPAGLTYLWSTGATTRTITVSATGSFYVDVTNGSTCTARSSTVNVTANALPDATITPSGPTTWCGTSSVTLSAPAGLTYLWSNGATTRTITVSATGSFYVDVTNGSNCTARSSTVNVTANALPDATITPSGPTTWCGNSSVTLSAPAGLTYLWNTGATTRTITVSATGSFYVDVTNGSNCTARSSTVNVTANALPDATITPSGPVTWCGNSSVTLSAPAGYTYLWSTGATTRTITVSASGSFYVDVNNGTCTARSSTVAVTANPNPNATVTVIGSLTLCPGSSVTLQAQPGYTYLWSNGSTQQSITVSTPGQYSVQVSNGTCSQQSQSFTVASQPATVITQQPVNTTMTRTQQKFLTVAATAAGGATYQWYEVSSTGVETQSTNAGNTTSQLTIGPYSKKGTYRYRVYAGSATCTSAPKVPSNIVTVTVN